MKQIQMDLDGLTADSKTLKPQHVDGASGISDDTPVAPAQHTSVKPTQQRSSAKPSQRNTSAQQHTTSQAQPNNNADEGTAGNTRSSEHTPVTPRTPAANSVQDSSDEQTQSEPQVYTVSEINKAIRQTLEGQFELIWIKGEISNFKAHTSGHFYFSLKDKKAQVNAVMFRGFNSRLKFRPESGMEVLVRGRITVYEPRGNYQVFCELMEPVGAGALQMAFEQLKAKLQAEGLFDQSRKRPLPMLPKHIALVTSPTGAAIRDMLNVLARRFKGVNITLIPALVQGEQAPASIVQGIQTANLLQDVDVLIVGRGGGSIEDLWGFNDENVARAIASSRIPVISAVGHEVDFTIADFVADLRAPTPSAAAELVIKNATDLLEKVTSYRRHILNCMAYVLNTHKRHLQQYEKRLVDPRRRLLDLSQRCDELSQRLEACAFRYIENKRTQVHLAAKRMGTPMERISRLSQRLQVASVHLRSLMHKQVEAKHSSLRQLIAVLNSISPLKVLERGYSIVSKNKHVVSQATELTVGDKVRLRFAKGEADAEILKIENKSE